MTEKNMKILILVLIVFATLKANIAMSQCSISATSIAFGTYDVFSNIPVDSSGTISISCIKDVVKASLTIGPSSASGTINPRKMKRSPGTDLLEYNIFVDVTRTVIFGDGAGGTTVVNLKRPSGKPQPWSQNIDIYGRIPPGQDVSAGSYADSVTATINW
jgi:spore coat protein U-like protein